MNTFQQKESLPLKGRAPTKRGSFHYSCRAGLKKVVPEQKVREIALKYCLQRSQMWTIKRLNVVGLEDKNVTETNILVLDLLIQCDFGRLLKPWLYIYNIYITYIYI